MADLNGQNIGTNYKGFLNLDSTINTPLDTTLRTVTDGMGNASILQLSTQQVGLSRTVALSAGSTNQRLFNEVYTINNSGVQTGTLTGLFLNATETALNGITHNLLDLQINNVSRFTVTNNNQLGIGGAGANAAIFLKRSDGQSILSLDANGIIGTYQGQNMTFQINSVTQMLMSANIAAQFNYPIRLSGSTNLFPMLKRNGAAIDFRLADDSAPCAITAATFTQTAGDFSTIISGTNFSITTSGGTIGYNGVSRFNSSLEVGTGGTSASAILQANSTTRGFLPPRMTTTQKNAIATPATGLLVFDTTLAKLAVYTGAGWETITSI